MHSLPLLSNFLLSVVLSKNEIGKRQNNTEEVHALGWVPN